MYVVPYTNSWMAASFTEFSTEYYNSRQNTIIICFEHM